MVNILTTRENRELSFNSVLQTSPIKISDFKRRACPASVARPRKGIRSYSNKSNSYFPKAKVLDPNWVTGLIEAEGSFMVFIKFNSNNNMNLVRQVQLYF